MANEITLTIANMERKTLKRAFEFLLEYPLEFTPEDKSPEPKNQAATQKSEPKKATTKKKASNKSSKLRKELRELLTQYRDKLGKPALKKLFGKYNAKTVKDIEEDQYADMMLEISNALNSANDDNDDDEDFLDDDE
jgi:hypothetical protein